VRVMLWQFGDRNEIVLARFRCMIRILAP